MKKLEKNLRKNGYDYELIQRTDKVALYAQTIHGDVIGYEVFFIKEQKESNVVIDNVKVHFEHKEAFPSNEDFGNIAWSFTMEKNAISRYEALIKV